MYTKLLDKQHLSLHYCSVFANVLHLKKRFSQYWINLLKESLHYNLKSTVLFQIECAEEYEEQTRLSVLLLNSLDWRMRD